jgi:hypothetical protein
LTDGVVATLTEQPTQPRIKAPRQERRRPADTRPRGVLAGSVAIVLALVVGLTLSSGAGEPAPATGAAEVVPADALIYLHFSTDPARPGVRRALALARRLPDFSLLSAALTNRLDTILGGALGAGVDFSGQVRPWLGKEAAFALLNTTTSTAGSLIVLDVRDHVRATAFLAAEGATPDGSYRRVVLLRQRSGTVFAFVRHYLIFGQGASVRAAIDAASRRAGSLASSAAYEHAAAGEPAGRVLDAYASVAGVRRVLAPRGGLLGALGVLLNQPALTGVTISVSAASGGAQVQIHGALDPTLARLSGPVNRAFTPTLTDLMPAGSTALLDVRGLSGVAPRVLAAGAAAGLGGGIGPLLGRLGSALRSEGVDVRRILSIFSGETAVAVSAARSGPHGRVHGPALVIVSRTRNQAATREALAALELPLAQLFPPPAAGPGQAAEFNDVQVAGVTVHQLSLAPGLQVDYAVFRNLVVLATNLQAIAAVARHSDPLSGEPAYQATLGNRPDQVTSLLFLDFNQLLHLGEQTGLTRSARLAALRPDLKTIRAIGLASTRGEADTTAELFLQIP